MHNIYACGCLMSKGVVAPNSYTQVKKSYHVRLWTPMWWVVNCFDCFLFDSIVISVAVQLLVVSGVGVAVFFNFL